MIGEVFGQRTVVALAEPDTNYNARVVCECSCGRRDRVLVFQLRAGQGWRCKSCASRGNHGRRTHGASGGSGKQRPEYTSWLAMHDRCSNPKDKRYANYGGRGIHVAAEWTGSGGFERFLAHVGLRPSGRHSIDRIDVNGHYERGNVRWATATAQQRNRTNNRILEHGGERLPLAEWAERLGWPRHTIETRIARGWSIEKALTTPRAWRGWPRKAA